MLFLQVFLVSSNFILYLFSKIIEKILCYKLFKNKLLYMLKRVANNFKYLKINKNNTKEYQKINLENCKEPNYKKIKVANISILDVDYSENFWKQYNIDKKNQKKY